MILTYDRLRQLKHSLPTGSIKKIANELRIDEQTVRNAFGAKKYVNGKVVGIHMENGPHGSLVNVQDEQIINKAMELSNANVT